MSIALRSDSGGTSGAIQINGVDKLTIDSTGKATATSFAGDGSQLTGVSHAGSASQTSATDVTLTASSAPNQYISITASGKYVILPDATTLSLLNGVFNIYNYGGNPFGIKDASGNILVKSVSSFGKVQRLTLKGKSTAAGKWLSDVYPLDLAYITTADIGLVTNVTLALTFLTSTSGLAFYVDSVGTNINVIGFTLSGTTFTFGTPVTVQAGVGMGYAFGSAANVINISTTVAAFAFNCKVSSNYVSKVVCVSLSGTTVTVGTAVQLVSNANAYSGCPVLCSLGAGKIGIAWGYLNGTNVLTYFRAATVSGTTITSGADVSLYNGPYDSFATCCSLGTDKALVAFGNPTLRAAVVTVSGTTSTLNTAITVLANVNTTASFPTYLTFTLNNNNVYVNTETGALALLSISGTTVTYTALVSISGHGNVITNLVKFPTKQCYTLSGSSLLTEGVFDGVGCVQTTQAGFFPAITGYYGGQVMTLVDSTTAAVLLADQTTGSLLITLFKDLG